MPLTRDDAQTALQLYAELDRLRVLKRETESATPEQVRIFSGSRNLVLLNGSNSPQRVTQLLNRLSTIYGDEITTVQSALTDLGFEYV